MQLPYTIQQTKDGSPTLFDREAGQCFKSQHAAKSESRFVFIEPGVLQNPLLHAEEDFRVLEIGFGLGTNFMSLLETMPTEYYGIENNLKAAKFYLEQKLPFSIEAKR